MAQLKGLNIEWKTRACHVDGRCGYFHTWEYYSQPVGESLISGGPPAGIFSKVFALVEFPDGGIKRVDPSEIKFCDLEYADLCAWQKHEDARQKETERSDD